MCVLNISGLLFVFGESPAMPWMYCALFITLGYITLWGLWQGHNWARWLVLLTSVLAVVNFAGLGIATWAQRIVIVAEGVLGVYLLYWLNTGPVRAYFGRRSGRVAA